MGIYSSFNPRARDGRDLVDPQFLGLLYVSIHAPVMDAIIRLIPSTTVLVFQSTRP